MTLRTCLASLAVALPQTAGAQVLFPTPDAEGCFAIAEDFTFCGAPLGWLGTAASHPEITAIFYRETDDGHLVFKLFDPETGTMGAFDGEPSEEAAEFMRQRWQARGIEGDLALARGTGGKVVRDTTTTLDGRAVRSVVVTYAGADTPNGTRVISEFTDVPWFLTVSTSSTGDVEQAWQQHLDALSALRIDK